MSEERFRQALDNSKVESLIKDYDKDELIKKEMKISFASFGFEVLLCATSFYNSGSKKNIDSI